MTIENFFCCYFNGHSQSITIKWFSSSWFIPPHQRTLLHLAAENGHVDIVTYLVAKKASINIKDDMGVSDTTYTYIYILLTELVLSLIAWPHTEFVYMMGMLHDQPAVLKAMYLSIYVCWFLSFRMHPCTKQLKKAIWMWWDTLLRRMLTLPSWIILG